MAGRQDGGRVVHLLPSLGSGQLVFISLSFFSSFLFHEQVVLSLAVDQQMLLALHCIDMELWVGPSVHLNVSRTLLLPLACNPFARVPRGNITTNATMFSLGPDAFYESSLCRRNSSRGPT